MERNKGTGLDRVTLLFIADLRPCAQPVTRHSKMVSTSYSNRRMMMTSNYCTSMASSRGRAATKRRNLQTDQHHQHHHHRRRRRQSGMKLDYGIDDNPPWHLCILLAFQVLHHHNHHHHHHHFQHSAGDCWCPVLFCRQALLSILLLNGTFVLRAINHLHTKERTKIYCRQQGPYDTSHVQYISSETERRTDTD